MENFDLGKVKIVSILIFILLVFALAIGNAYKYLPSENSEIPNVNNSEVSQPVDEDEESASVENNENLAEEHPNEVQNQEQSYTYRNEENYATPNTDQLENISNDNYENNNSDGSFDEKFANAMNLKKDKQLVDAINEFKSAINLAENSKQKADCYEQIATIYAISKKYGSALSSAQTAYNLSPSTSREILLARLYYKTGNPDKANDRMSNILRRDFSMDN